MLVLILVKHDPGCLGKKVVLGGEEVRDCVITHRRYKVRDTVSDT